jgi:hypothetical protein
MARLAGMMKRREAASPHRCTLKKEKVEGMLLPDLGPIRILGEEWA